MELEQTKVEIQAHVDIVKAELKADIEHVKNRDAGIACVNQDLAVDGRQATFRRQGASLPLARKDFLPAPG